jgi:hypothetical protein
MVMFMLLSACASQKLDDYSGNEPKADLKSYFNGTIKAWGLIQDFSGKVVSRFDVTMHGSWKGDVGTLKEDFNYYDGTKQQRVWTITRTADGKYEGSASDIIGKAEGATNGNAVRWSYDMNVPIDGKTFRISFDDWMWRMNDGVMINRSYLKKFGFTVAELTLFMKKE